MKGLHMIQFARRAVFLAAASVAAALVLSACGGSSGANPPPSSAASSSSSAGAGQGAPSGAPAAAGKVAAISGTTMQVQNEQTGQVAVSWSASTKFRHQVAVTIADVKAGDCVAAVAPSGTDSSVTSFTATTLTISPPVNGSCTGGAAGPGGPGGGRFTGAPPSGFPSGKLPSGLPSGVQGRPVAAVAAGKVTSVSGSTLVVAARQFGSNSTSTTNKTVTVDEKTKITTEVTTTSKSLKVGKCVTAQGKADSAGTVAATSVRITDPTNGQCGIFFGGFGGKGNG
jgi:hypothetical protein